MAWRIAVALLLVTNILAVYVSPSAAQEPGLSDFPSYSVTDLGSFMPADINNSGQIVGTISERAAMWHETIVFDLGVLPGTTRSYGNAINNAGVVVGESISDTTLGSRGFQWSQGTNMVDLGVQIGGTDSSALDINDLGVIVGRETVSDGQIYVDHAVRWDAGIATDLGALPGFSGSTAQLINNHGMIVGQTGPATFFVPRVVAWYPGNEISDIGLHDESLARGINDLGQVVGHTIYYVDPGDYFSNRAFVWDEANGQQWLSMPEGHASLAEDINNNGLIIGVTGVAPIGIPPEVIPYMWHEETGVNLNTLIPSDSGWQLQIPTAINDQNQIVGVGMYDGEWHGFLLTPSTPEESLEERIYYFALGDSIAAGHGLADNGPGNEDKAQDKCRRAQEFNYPGIVLEELKNRYGSDRVFDAGDFSCSGATAIGPKSGTRHGQYKSLAGQVSEIEKRLTATDPTTGDLIIPKDATVFVSITIGANDFEFGSPDTFGRLFLWPENSFSRVIQRRSGQAEVGLSNSLKTLIEIRPDMHIVLTELYNPFNPTSVFFASERSRLLRCDQCYERTERVVELWNRTLREIASFPAFRDNVVVTEGLQAAFYDHRSPGGEGPNGGYSYAGGGCGLTGPGPEGQSGQDNATWIQYRNDANSWSYSVPPGLGNAPWFGNLFKDPDIFYNPNDTGSAADVWRGDCFHPNRAGSQAIAEFVVVATVPLLVGD